jgi:Fe-S-cluster containining protein
VSIEFECPRCGHCCQQKQWVSLTDEEIKEIIGPWGETPIKGYTRKLFDAIEAKLKEKNI